MNHDITSPPRFLCVHPQEVDVANHNWANYFVCAYKVGSFAAAGALICLIPLHVLKTSAAQQQTTSALVLARLSRVSMPPELCPGALQMFTSVLLQGAFELLKAKSTQVPEPCGLQIMVDGTVPLGRCVTQASRSLAQPQWPRCSAVQWYLKLRSSQCLCQT